VGGWVSGGDGGRTVEGVGVVTSGRRSLMGRRRAGVLRGHGGPGWSTVTRGGQIGEEKVGGGGVGPRDGSVDRG